MAREEEYVFEDNKKTSKLGGIGKFLWNSRTKEFCGRDGASWGKVSLFYAIFYLILGSFFVGMIAVFVQIMPKDRPTYIMEESTMALRGVNPGLGFRPQVDVEDSLVKYNPSTYDDSPFGYKKYVTNINNFLNAKYPAAAKGEGGEGQTFDHKAHFATTPCSSSDPEAKYGFDTANGCFLIKLNKIYGWTPGNGTSVGIRCEGEFSADRDNLLKTTYHSEGDVNSDVEGKILPQYFPFTSQKGYQAPFIWVQFDVNPNTLINIVCKAYSSNIDNTDRVNRRGQTKFTLYVKSNVKQNQ